LLWLKDCREFIAINPKQKKGEQGNNNRHGKTAAIEKDMVKDNINDDRAKQDEAERNEPRMGEQAEAADNLKGGDRINVTTVNQCAHESAGVALHRGHGNEVQKRIGTEDDKNETKKDAGNDNEVFHKAVK
jgi:hypothetical protein